MVKVYNFCCYDVGYCTLEHVIMTEIKCYKVEFEFESSRLFSN